jgi:predicted DNA-binding transcriptional regulator YafY
MLSDQSLTSAELRAYSLGLRLLSDWYGCPAGTARRMLAKSRTAEPDRALASHLRQMAADMEAAAADLDDTGAHLMVLPVCDREPSRR